MRVKKDCTFEEFMQINSTSDNRVEFIGGKIMMAPSPSISHQRVSGNLYFELRKYFSDKSFEVFSAPTLIGVASYFCGFYPLRNNFDDLFQ